MEERENDFVFNVKFRNGGYFNIRLRWWTFYGILLAFIAFLVWAC